MSSACDSADSLASSLNAEVLRLETMLKERDQAMSEAPPITKRYMGLARIHHEGTYEDVVTGELVTDPVRIAACEAEIQAQCDAEDAAEERIRFCAEKIEALEKAAPGMAVCITRHAISEIGGSSNVRRTLDLDFSHAWIIDSATGNIIVVRIPDSVEEFSAFKTSLGDEK